MRDDAALLQLANFQPGRWHAVPMAFQDALVNGSGGVTMFGYGDSGWTQEGNPNSSTFGTLRKSPDGAFVRSPSCDGKVYADKSSSFVVVGSCFKRTGSTRVMEGDSGAPWLRWNAGAWQLIAVNDATWSSYTESGVGNPSSGVSTLQTFRSNPSLLNWVRATTKIPGEAPGTILRDPTTKNAWLLQPDGYRNWIPTGGDYLCFSAQGHPVANLAQITIDTFPDRVGTHATCTSGSQPSVPRIDYVWACPASAGIGPALWCPYNFPSSQSSGQFFCVGGGWINQPGSEFRVTTVYNGVVSYSYEGYTPYQQGGWVPFKWTLPSAGSGPAPPGNYTCTVELLGTPTVTRSVDFMIQ